jgi:ribosome-binding factor A
MIDESIIQSTWEKNLDAMLYKIFKNREDDFDRFFNLFKFFFSDQLNQKFELLKQNNEQTLYFKLKDILVSTYIVNGVLLYLIKDLETAKVFLNSHDNVDNKIREYYISKLDGKNLRSNKLKKNADIAILSNIHFAVTQTAQNSISNFDDDLCEQRFKFLHSWSTGVGNLYLNYCYQNKISKFSKKEHLNINIYNDVIKYLKTRDLLVTLNDIILGRNESALYKESTNKNFLRDMFGLD